MNQLCSDSKIVVLLLPDAFDIFSFTTASDVFWNKDAHNKFDASKKFYCWTLLNFEVYCIHLMILGMTHF